MDNKVSKLVGLISELAFKLNNTETKKQLTNNKPTVFVYFLGHICLLEVRVFMNGWDDKNTDYPKQFNIVLDNESILNTNKPSVEEQLKAIVKLLKKLIKEWC